jgi:hypothetical protein
MGWFAAITCLGHRRSPIERGELLIGQAPVERAEVGLCVMSLGRARDGDHVRIAREQPVQRNLALVCLMRLGRSLSQTRNVPSPGFAASTVRLVIFSTRRSAIPPILRC